MNDRFNSFKVLHHAFQTIDTPFHFQVDIMGACNHRCPFCFFREGAINTGVERNSIRNLMLPTDVALRAIDQFKEAGVKALTFAGGGEPLLHPQANAILGRVLERGMEYGLITNLSRMPDLEVIRAATWVRVSVDAASDSIYRKMHDPIHGDFAQLIDHVSKLVGKTDIGVSFLIHRENWHEAFEAAKMFKDLRASYIQFKPVYDEDRTADIQPFLDDIHALLHRAEGLADDSFDVINLIRRVKDVAAPERTFKRCHMTRYQAQLGADGHLYPCCVLKYEDRYSYGDMALQSFREIWSSERKRQVDQMTTAKACPPCWYDEANNLLEYLARSNAKHVNFV